MNKINQVYEQRPKNLYKIIINIIIILLVLYPTITDLSSEINEKGFSVVNQIIKGFYNPNWEFMFGLGEKDLPYLFLETLGIAFLGTFIGAIIALPLSFLAAKNIVNKYVTYIFNFILIVIRTIPIFVWAVVFVKMIGQTAFTGVMTLAVTSIGMLAKLYVESIEEIDKKLLDSGESLGLTKIEKFKYIIWEQLKANFLSTAIYRFDINVKNASILGIVGAGGIGTALEFSRQANNWQNVATIILCLIIIVLIIDYISTKIRKKLI